MPRTKISKAAIDLNVAVPTIIEFLRKKGIKVDDSPNARIDEDVYEILVKEYKPDRALKSESEKISVDRQAAKTKPAPRAEEIKLEPEPARGPKVLGKIDLSNGRQVADKPKETEPVKAPAESAPKKEAPKAEAPKQAPAKVETPKAEAPKPEAPKAQASEVQKPKEANQAAAKTETQKPEAKDAPKAEPQQKSEPKAPQAEKPVQKAEEPKTQEAPKAQEEVFTLGTPKVGPQINVIGKIDLSTINQSTRPKKKGKEERRAAAKANAQAVQTGDKKKRKRIGGKEKIDIENPGQQIQSQGRNDNKSRDDRRGNRGNRDKARHQQHAEVSEEDVQKQVKETLARLTSKDKGQKKGVKWRKEKREAVANREREAQELEAAESKVLKLTEFVTANDLASMMNVPINNVIATCMNLGVMVSINQRLDAETINIVAEEFGFQTEYVSAEVVEAIAQEEDDESQLMERPPIVTVMGHVDHGKTSLLDYIRNANVIAGEAGGITQHIGAYNVKLADGRHITFLDTPGHEAFTAMRARGAKVTDICIIIVAADDNVMPQTVEAINHASAAGVPIVFAINKIDKPAANPDKVKEELANMNYLVEEWGGKYQSQDISAKKGTGVEELMEKVLLEAEMLELKANPNRNATGSIIESSLDKGRGYIATVLVQNGTLRVGDTILAGTHYGKVKAMFNERNQRIKSAGPAEPALILGLNGAPTAGDTFNVMDTEQEAREIATKREQLQRELGLRTKKILTLEDIGRRRAIGNFQELNIIVKGDVDGSIEALSDALIKLSTPEIQVNVLHKAVGAISESDVTLAAGSDASIFGVVVRPAQ
ncbi:MAG: translation initiation factor IF-2, partial [Paramuribaculum sp.]|nr:translation initiation factor IF-2 [Paramuribaculum sp.]